MARYSLLTLFDRHNAPVVPTVIDIRAGGVVAVHQGDTLYYLNELQIENLADDLFALAAKRRAALS